MDKLELKSREAEKLGFQEIKNTLELIKKSKIKLPGKLDNEISILIESVDSILSISNKNKKVNFSKVKGAEVNITCSHVNIILKKINEKLKGVNLEEKEKELNEMKELIKGKNLEDYKEGIEVYGEEKEQLEKEIKNIQLLKTIITKINNFKEKLEKIFEEKEKVKTKKVEQKTEKTTKIETKKIPTKPENSKQTNDQSEKEENNLETEKEKQAKLDISQLPQLYKGKDFHKKLKESWELLSQTEKLNVCDFLVGQKETNILKEFFKAGDYSIRKLSKEENEILDKIINYLDSLKPKAKENPKITEKKVVEIKTKTPEEKFENESDYKLDENFFNKLNNKEKFSFIQKLINSEIEDITIYDFVINFVISEESEDVISYEFLKENQKRLGIEVKEEELIETPVEETKKPKVIHIGKEEKPKVSKEIKDEYGNFITPATNLREAGIKAFPGANGKTKLRKPYQKIHNKGKILTGKEAEIEKIEISLNYHFPIFEKKGNFSEAFIKYLENNNESNLFVEKLANKLIKQTESFIKEFLEKLEELNFNKDFYSKMSIYTNKIEIEDKEKKTLILNFLEDKRDPNFELIEELTEKIYNNQEKENNEEEIEKLLSKGTKTLENYIQLFKIYNNTDFLLERYKKQNTTNIINNKKYDNSIKIEYFKSFREAFIRNFKSFDTPNDIVKMIRALDRNLKRLGVEQTISDISIISTELEELNKVKEEEIKQAEEQIISNLKLKGKNNSGKSWYEIGIEKLDKIKGPFTFSFCSSIIPHLKNDDITKYYKNGKIPNTDEIKNYLYLILKERIFSEQDNIDLFRELSKFKFSKLGINKRKEREEIKRVFFNKTGEELNLKNN